VTRGVGISHDLFCPPLSIYVPLCGFSLPSSLLMPEVCCSVNLPQKKKNGVVAGSEEM